MELFTFAQVTLIQYSTIAGHLPSPIASSVTTKLRRKQANKVEVAPSDPPKEEVQANAVSPPKQKGKRHPRGQPPATPPKDPTKQAEGRPSNQHNKGNGKGMRGMFEKNNHHSIPFYRGRCKKGDNCNYEHQVDAEGKPILLGQEFVQRSDDAIKRSTILAKSSQGCPTWWCWSHLHNQCCGRAAVQVSEDCLRYGRLGHQCCHCSLTPRSRLPRTGRWADEDDVTTAATKKEHAWL